MTVPTVTKEAALDEINYWREQHAETVARLEAERARLDGELAALRVELNATRAELAELKERLSS